MDARKKKTDRKLAKWEHLVTVYFNGKVGYDEQSKHRTLWTDSSFHMEFLSDARKKVSKWRFVNSVNKEPTPRQPPCLINLRRTLKGFQQLWALGANCEDDGGASLLAWQNYLEFVAEPDESGELTPWPEGTPQNPSGAPKIICSKNPIPEKGNVSATIALLPKSLKKKCEFLHSCPICVSFLSSDNGSSYQLSKSVSPIQEIHREVNGILNRITDSIYAKQGVQKYATNFLRREIQFDILTCRIHKDALIASFYKCSIELHILSTTSYLNRIL